MEQSFAKGSGLRLKPLALGLALVLAAGSVQAQPDVPMFGLQQQRERRQEVFEQIRERFHRNPRTVLKIAAGAQTRDPDVLAQLLAERDAKLAERAASIPPRPAGTVAVANCDDDGAGSLREAVANAIDGDEIDLTALTCSTITLTSGGIAVEVDHLTITGPGADALTIDANGGGTAFDFYGTDYSYEGTLSISGVTIANGYFVDAGGGAVWASSYHDVEITDSVVTDSTSYGKYANGGGVSAGGSVTLTNSTVSDNLADSSKYDGFGGGVYTEGSLTVVSSTISGNTANSNGNYYYYSYYGDTYYYWGLGIGGGAVARGDITIANSTVSGNEAAWGGGLLGFSDALEIQNSTVTGNTVNASHNSYPSGYGSYNFAEGGGVVAYGGAVTLNSSILAGNTAPTNDYYGEDFGIYTGSVSGANNLVVDSSTPLPGDTLTADPLLGPLADNGGPTQTHALLDGSPAIDAGNNVAGLATDQRGDGYDRVVGAAADIGAFEVQGEDPGPGPGPLELAPFRSVPATSNWALGLIALLLGFIGWRRTER